MSILAYQFPNEEIKIFKGTWKKEILANLPEDHFFITDFTKENIYYFEVNEEIYSFSNESLSINDDDMVFSVNGRYYLNGLQYFLDGFESSEIEKAIYSRINMVNRNGEKLEHVFRNLAKAYHNQALVYVVSDPQFGTWMGATPEILLSGNNKVLRTMALAGTKSEKEIEWTEKELVEHQYVVDYVENIIANYHPLDLQVFDTKTVKNGAVYHLRTDFEFSLAENTWNALMNDLHPTPAVCGTPMEKAKEYILQLEPHDREFYTGMLGWRGKEDIEVYVNLRCMQVMKNNFALYVGGGITKDSDLANEWEETEAKSKTLLEIITSS